MKTYSEKNKFGITFHSSQRLPPSSIRTFYSNDNIKAPAMVLTDFGEYSYWNLNFSVFGEFQFVAQIYKMYCHELILYIINF